MLLLLNHYYFIRILILRRTESAKQKKIEICYSCGMPWDTTVGSVTTNKPVNWSVCRKISTSDCVFNVFQTRSTFSKSFLHKRGSISAFPCVIITFTHSTGILLYTITLTVTLTLTLTLNPTTQYPDLQPSDGRRRKSVQHIRNSYCRSYLWRSFGTHQVLPYRVEWTCFSIPDPKCLHGTPMWSKYESFFDLGRTSFDKKRQGISPQIRRQLVEHPSNVIRQNRRYGSRWDSNDVEPFDLPSRGGEQKK